MAQFSVAKKKVVNPVHFTYRPPHMHRFGVRVNRIYPFTTHKNETNKQTEIAGGTENEST
jgi:hypothetical protein